MMDNKPLILVAGPTAVGKTALAVALAQQINGEIVSADSMQVYRKMNIGTAKATPAEMGGIPHHLIDCLEPDAPFSVAQFQSMAQCALHHIYSQNKLPIVVGGTGFYINALLRGTDFTAAHAADRAYRDNLAALADEKGRIYLHGMLKKADPAAAAAIHPHNVKRVIRALEYIKQTGSSIAAHNAREKLKASVYDAKVFIIHCDRAALYEKINRRVDGMIAAGLLDEVAGLLAAGYGPGLASMQALGYKEMIPVVQGAMPLAEAQALLKRNTRRFAKRQLTWFRRQCDGTWLDSGAYRDIDELCRHMVNILMEMGMIS